MVEKADVVSWTFPKSIDYDAAKDFVTSLMTTGEPQEAKLAARKRGGEKGYPLAGGSAAVVRFAVLVPTVYKEAKQKRIGQELPDEWFDQQIDTYPTYRLR